MVTASLRLRNSGQRSLFDGFSPDGRTCFHAGRYYRLTEMQARAVRVLRECRAAGWLALDQAYLLAEIDSDCQRLRDLFRQSGEISPAWNVLVGPAPECGRGMVRLLVD